VNWSVSASLPLPIISLENPCVMDVMLLPRVRLQYQCAISLLLSSIAPTHLVSNMLTLS
jgi:hypothetical protein